MIIEKMVKYYDMQAKYNPESIPLNGYSVAEFAGVIQISEKGEFLGIVSLLQETTVEVKETKKKKSKKKKGMALLDETPVVKTKIITKPTQITVPLKAKRGSNIQANFAWDNAQYIFNVQYNKDTKQFEKAISKKGETGIWFEAFKKLQKAVLGDSDNPSIQAYLNFINTFDSDQHFDSLIKDYENILKWDKNFVFQISSEPDKFFHENDEVQKRWMNYFLTNKDDVLMQCSITGEVLPVEGTHAKIMKFWNAQPSGATLVSSNQESFCSYGRLQNYNSVISREASFKYTTVLNKLLADNNNNIVIDNLTTVFWAMSPDKKYEEIASKICKPNQNIKNDEFEELDDIDAPDKNKKDEEPKDFSYTKQNNYISGLLQKYKNGEKISSVVDVPKDCEFCILGMSPNAGRIAIKYFYIDTFYNFVQRIFNHYSNMSIIKERSYNKDTISLWEIAYETISPSSKEDKPHPLLMGAVSKAIFTGNMYPELLYSKILERIKTDTKIRVNYKRAAILKAFLLKKAEVTNNQKLKEEITYMLNENSDNIGYLLGRVFAVLEKLQIEAIPNLEKTIKHKYFASACTTPSLVFNTLISSAQHHIPKARNKEYLEGILQSVLSKIPNYPKHLNLEEQGLFSLGYYHQKASLYTSNKNKKMEENKNVGTN